MKYSMEMTLRVNKQNEMKTAKMCHFFFYTIVRLFVFEDAVKPQDNVTVNITRKHAWAVQVHSRNLAYDTT